MRRAAVVCVAFWLVSALFLGIGAIAANPSATDAESGFVGRIGDEREAAGLGGYVVAADLVDVARRHAEEMRRQQRLHHNPRLGDDVQGWQAVGENVGVGPTVEALHQKFMESPTHRENILSGRYTEVGVGVVADGADLWVVQVFRLPRAAEPEPSSSSSTPPGEDGSGAATSPPTTSAPAPAPTPRSATGAGSSRGGTVRAAANEAATASTAPAPPATVAEVLARNEVPTTLADPSPSTADTAPSTASSAGAAPVPVPGTTLEGKTVVDTDIRTTAGRQVTWPVALAATMLLGVVAAVGVHVAGARLRPSIAAADRRMSLLDVWELALAG